MNKEFIPTMKKLLFFLFLFGASRACTQVPEVRPSIQNPAFDQRLTELLSFTIPLIGVKELKQNLNNYQILDAREREEYDISHIPGALYIGYKAFDESLTKKLDKQKPIVVYCSVGYRSEKIAERLRALGFQKVYNLYGSIFEWANLGYPLVDTQGQITHRIHTYNEAWSRWVEAKGLEEIW